LAALALDDRRHGWWWYATAGGCCAAGCLKLLILLLALALLLLLRLMPDVMELDPPTVLPVPAAAATPPLLDTLMDDLDRGEHNAKYG